MQERTEQAPIDDDTSSEASIPPESSDNELLEDDIQAIIAAFANTKCNSSTSNSDMEFLLAALTGTGPSNENLPKSLKEAYEGPNEPEWRAAMDEEVQALVNNDVFDVVPLPKGVRPITSRPIFRIKFDAKGDIERFKIRIVARGFTQTYGIDYKEVFAPVANQESI